MKLIPEQTVVVGETVNVVGRAEAPFFREPYRGAEVFETRSGLLVLQVKTLDLYSIFNRQACESRLYRLWIDSSSPSNWPDA